MDAKQTVSDRDQTFISDLTTAITATDGTSGRDYYLIHGGDDIVVSSDGSDEFDIGFDASDGEYSSGIVYNALYDAMELSFKSMKIMQTTWMEFPSKTCQREFA